MSPASRFLPGVIDPPSDTTWDDLVLPAQQIKSLREYVLWVTQRTKVVQEWGAKLTSGPLALFSGPSGTGKTIAARLLGSVLKLDLYTVDARLLTGRYVGETEKHVDDLFDAVSREPLLLLFDEADSLFEKRSEVNDAHDRYANAEANHLLSRLERYQGPCVMTSNTTGRIDPAFLRRLPFIVDFPLPDAAARARLWRMFLPPRAPVDENIVVRNLAEKFELTGGQIRNAALRAAFVAAGDSSPMTRELLIEAAQAELSGPGGA